MEKGEVCEVCGFWAKCGAYCGNEMGGGMFPFAWGTANRVTWNTTLWILLQLHTARGAADASCILANSLTTSDLRR